MSVCKTRGLAGVLGLACALLVAACGETAAEGGIEPAEQAEAEETLSIPEDLANANAQMAEDRYAGSEQATLAKAIRATGALPAPDGFEFGDLPGDCGSATFSFLHPELATWHQLSPDSNVKSEAAERMSERALTIDDVQFLAGDLEAAVLEAAAQRRDWSVWYTESHALPGHMGIVVTFGPNGEILMPGACHHGHYVRPVEDYASKVGVSAQDVFLSLMLGRDPVLEAAVVGEPETLESLWERASFDERFLFDGRTPQSVLDGLELTMYEITVPLEWTRYEATVCALTHAGWGPCFLTTASDDPAIALTIPVYHHSSDEVEWLLVDDTTNMKSAQGVLFRTESRGGGVTHAATVEGQEASLDTLRRRAQADSSRIDRQGIG